LPPVRRESVRPYNDFALFASKASANVSGMKALIFLLPVFAAVSVMSAEPIVVIVRHAEKTDNSQDADLSPAGRQRAETLARMLKDANISAIFTSEFKRTQQTAGPTATATGITPTIVPGKDFGGLVSKLREVKGNALVVGHGNTIPDIVKALGIDTPVQIADADYSEIFVVTLNAKPQLMRLHYP
jgi:2,3-bisphosphoglycerate-dependent phosphoglycerate mutase